MHFKNAFKEVSYGIFRPTKDIVFRVFRPTKDSFIGRKTWQVFRPTTDKPESLTTPIGLNVTLAENSFVVLKSSRD